MTGENRKQNIADELAKATDAFRAADTLINVIPRDASGADLSWDRSEDARRYDQAVQSRVDPKEGSSPFNKLLTGLAGSREAADYETSVSFTVDEARAILTEVEAFRTVVLDLLRREGWLSS